MTTIYPPETNNGVVTAWIPLTTGWTDVPDCNTQYVLYRDTIEPGLVFFSEGSMFSQEKPETRSTFLAFDSFWGISAAGGGNACLPSEITAWTTLSPHGVSYHIQGYDTVLSTITSILPLRCPDAWSTVATFVKSSISTQVMCCPGTYFMSHSTTFSTGVEGVCLSTIDSGAVLEYIYLGSGMPGVPLIPSLWSAHTISSVTRSRITLASKITAEAAAIVGWNVQPTGLPTSNLLTSPIGSNLLTSFSTQTSSSPSTNGHELSSGVKAGIGVSAGVGILIIFTLIVWTVILKRRNRKISAKSDRSEESQTQSSRTDSNGVLGLPQPCELDHEGSRKPNGSQINELSHENLCELDQQSLRELDPNTLPVELSVATPKTLTAKWEKKMGGRIRREPEQRCGRKGSRRDENEDVDALVEFIYARDQTERRVDELVNKGNGK